MMDQSPKNNHTRMEHLLLSATTLWSKYIAIGSARLGGNLIAESNQESASIYRRGHSDWYFPFGSWKSGNKISVNFGQNVDEKNRMNP